jgi:hypothetical protein
MYNKHLKASKVSLSLSLRGEGGREGRGGWSLLPPLLDLLISLEGWEGRSMCSFER